MLKFMRSFVGWSLHRMGGVYMRLYVALTVPFAVHPLTAPSEALDKAATPVRHVTSELVAVLARINHRLDSIEEKINRLLVPLETTKA